MDNVSLVTVLTLSGLNAIGNHRAALFSVTLLCYCVILLVNVTLIVTIIVDRSLHEPMYIFLCNLCISALYGTAGLYPKLLFDMLSDSHVISYAACVLQGFVTHAFTGIDLSILTLMAYDRYVAICQPLVYHSVMTKLRVSVLVFFAWLVPQSCMFMYTITISRSKLCGSHIPKLYCVNWLIGKLACSTSIATVVIPTINITVYIVHVVFIVWTYVYMIRTCLRSNEERGKFIHTCVPHLISVGSFVVTVLLDVMYMRFGSKDLSQNLQNFMAIEIFLFTPLINPLIYGFKMTKIRNKILRSVNDKRRNWVVP